MQFKNLAMAGLMALALAACGGDDNDNNDNGNQGGNQGGDKPAAYEATKITDEIQKVIDSGMKVAPKADFEAKDGKKYNKENPIDLSTIKEEKARIDSKDGNSYFQVYKKGFGGIAVQATLKDGNVTAYDMSPIGRRTVPTEARKNFVDAGLTTSYEGKAETLGADGKTQESGVFKYSMDFHEKKATGEITGFNSVYGAPEGTTGFTFDGFPKPDDTMHPTFVGLATAVVKNAGKAQEELPKGAPMDAANARKTPEGNNKDNFAYTFYIFGPKAETLAGGISLKGEKKGFVSVIADRKK